MLPVTTRGPQWSADARAVWGKSCRDDETLWLPLVQHLWDAQRVAGLLWDEWVPNNVRRVIGSSLPEDARDGRTLVSWLAGIHDVGKSSPAFSVQVPHLADRMRAAGAAFPGDTKDRREAPHATVGQVALEDWLKARFGAAVRARKSIAAVVGAHHGKAPTSPQLNAARDRRDLRGEGVWHAVREEILDEMAEVTGASRLLPAWLSHGGLSPRAQVLAVAIVIVADWIASDEARFAYRPDFTTDTARADAAWSELALPARWSPTGSEDEVDDTSLLADRFPALAGQTTRPVQADCLEVARSAGGPCLVIVEAPMGVGKTEAALLAAEELALRQGLNGVFIGLPTMATADAMFDRVLPWIRRLPARATVSTFLAHSRAGLNTSYAELPAAGREDAGVDQVGRINGVSDHEGEPVGPSTPRAEAVAASWLRGRKRGALSSFVVGTVDQALFAALHARHLMLRHLAMAGKVVVLDEVHAADDYMRMYLTRALEWFAAYGVPVVLLSATLPSAQRAQLVEAYRVGLGSAGTAIEPTTAYPAITTADRDGVTVAAPDDDGRSVDVSVHLLDESEVDLVDLLRRDLSDGGCAAVIRNTVGRAQETYQRLVDELGGDSVTLLHSQLVAPERARRERLLRDLLGPPGGSTPRPLLHVVVGTQVLEQSLDVDFDLMVTDVAPVDLLLQRIGRLHRHVRTGRPPAVSRPVCHVAGVTLTAGDPELDSGSDAVYGRSRLLRSLIALDLHAGGSAVVRLPADIRALVERAYAEDCDPPPAWADDLAHSDGEHGRRVAEARGRASVYRLASPPRPGYALGEFLTEPVDAAEDRAGGATVRDGDGSLDVIVIRELDGQWRLLPGQFAQAGAVVPGELETPSPHLARALAASTLRLPHRMCRPWVLDRVIGDLERRGFASWQASDWLQGQLVLPLDDELRAQVAGFDLTYDLDLGLLVSREGATP